MATFSGLFNFPDLSGDESELSSPPNSSELGDSEEEEEDEDAWYNYPSNSDDSDNESPEPCLTLPSTTSTAFTIPKTTRKEHTAGARIKAIYMLE
jgi:hypothetical protein